MRNAIAWGVVCCTLFGAAIGLGSGIARAQAGPAMNANLVLDHGWQFRQVTADAKEGQNGWLSATVPGDVHLDLLANKKIADPYFLDNEAKLPGQVPSARGPDGSALAICIDLEVAHTQCHWFSIAHAYLSEGYIPTFYY